MQKRPRVCDAVPGDRHRAVLSGKGSSRIVAGAGCEHGSTDALPNTLDLVKTKDRERPDRRPDREARRLRCRRPGRKNDCRERRSDQGV